MRTARLVTSTRRRTGTSRLPDPWPNPQSIAAQQLASLAGLSERHLRRLAEAGWLPCPARNQYPLVAAIQGLLRYYREREENFTVRDAYPSFEACAAGTGIPVELLTGQTPRLPGPARQPGPTGTIPAVVVHVRREGHHQLRPGTRRADGPSEHQAQACAAAAET